MASCSRSIDLEAWNTWPHGKSSAFGKGSADMTVVLITMIVVALLWVVALCQVGKADLDQTAKAIWVLVIIIAPVIGAITWFAIGNRNRSV